MHYQTKRKNKKRKGKMRSKTSRNRSRSHTNPIMVGGEYDYMKELKIKYMAVPSFTNVDLKNKDYYSGTPDIINTLDIEHNILAPDTRTAAEIKADPINPATKLSYLQRLRYHIAEDWKKVDNVLAKLNIQKNKSDFIIKPKHAETHIFKEQHKK